MTSISSRFSLPFLALVLALGPALAQDSPNTANYERSTPVVVSPAKAENPAAAAAPPATDADKPAPPPETQPADVINVLGDPRDRVFYPGDTERLKPLGKKLLSNILMDQKEIWRSPFRMKAKDVKWWVGFGALTAALVATDHRTSNSFQNSPGQIAWGNRTSKLGATYTIIPAVAGLYGFGVLRDDSKARRTAVLGAEALLDSLIVVQTLKPLIGRNRPDSVDENGHFFEGGNSFPSGHAMQSWALASVVAHEYKDSKFIPILAYGLATAISASRFAGQKHYASDLVAGGAIGWFIGRYVYQTHHEHEAHYKAWLHPQVIPDIRPSEKRYGIALKFNFH